MGEELNNQNYKIYFNGQEMGEVKELKVVGVDLAGEEVNVQSFKSVSGNLSVHKRSVNKFIKKHFGVDCKYLKRVKNRQKLYEKKLKLGRRL